VSAVPDALVRVLVVEDEPLARARLCELLAEVPWLACIGEAADGVSAIARIDALRPDLVLLDVQLPECSGLEVLERSSHEPAVIFTTAYDRYAVAAFEFEALDYLLKPFGRERLNAALERARRMLPGRAAADADSGASTQAPDAPPAPVPPMRDRARSALAGTGPITRLLVRDRGRLVPVQLREVERLEAEDDYVALHVAGRRYLVEVSLGEFEARLDAQRFVRVHRAHIVNLDFVRQLVPFDGARLMVEMRDGAKILASRTRSRDLRELAI
jgi:two-component system LytT family response regulator